MKVKQNTAVSGKEENAYEDKRHQIMSKGKSSKQKRHSQKQDMRAIFDDKPRKGNRAIIDDRILQ
jgi:hypothetical protein